MKTINQIMSQAKTIATNYRTHYGMATRRDLQENMVTVTGPVSIKNGLISVPVERFCWVTYAQSACRVIIRQLDMSVKQIIQDRVIYKGHLSF
jgi:hypothetical protein